MEPGLGMPPPDCASQDLDHLLGKAAEPGAGDCRVGGAGWRWIGTPDDSAHASTGESSSSSRNSPRP